MNSGNSDIEHKNKFIILLMSCNKTQYEEEEKACRETFLHDADISGIPYYFYKGGHDEQKTDEEAHTMHLTSPDNLAGTARKTIEALKTALKYDWDYVVKTNVSTWLDINKIHNTIQNWEGRDDRNIYGARFIINNISKNVPFPRGNFMILSRSTVEGMLTYADTLNNISDLPKTDDTLLCLSLLYYIQKVLGDNYVERLMEVPSVNTFADDIQDAPEWNDALSVRCKDEVTRKNTPENIRLVHGLKNRPTVRRNFRKATMFETAYGIMPYKQYEVVNAIFNAIKVKKTKDKTEEKST